MFEDDCQYCEGNGYTLYANDEEGTIEEQRCWYCNGRGTVDDQDA